MLEQHYALQLSPVSRHRRLSFGAQRCAWEGQVHMWWCTCISVLRSRLCLSLTYRSVASTDKQGVRVVQEFHAYRLTCDTGNTINIQSVNTTCSSDFSPDSGRSGASLRGEELRHPARQLRYPALSSTSTNSFTFSIFFYATLSYTTFFFL